MPALARLGGGTPHLQGLEPKSMNTPSSTSNWYQASPDCR
jgi:hypothetical protein